MRREYEKVTCPGCGWKVSAYVPHMGDGSGLRVVPHNARDEENGHHGRCDVGGRIIVFDRAIGAWRIDL